MTTAEQVVEGEVVELLQQLIRNECVNDDRVESGNEIRSADVLESYLEGSGLDIATYDAAPGRRSLVARIEGTDPTAPTLLLYGADSWASNPEKDGRIAHFRPGTQVVEFEKAGHWLHHDQFDRFMATLRDFL